MKITLLLLAVCVAMSMASAIQSRQQKKEVPVNRPRIDALGPRPKRIDAFRPEQKQISPPRPIPLEFQVTKGEYVCGDKICKLTPGVEPPGCNGMCQYPLK